MSAIIYWLAVRLYGSAIRISALFHPKAKLFVAGRKQLLSRVRYALLTERRPRVWMHCASLGEFEQGRPLLERLRQHYPQYAFVVTFFSPSGYEVRKDYAGADYIFYLPTDSKKNAKDFIEALQPALCIFVKYDFWYFHLSALAARDIPLILISAIFRKEQGFFKWYGDLQRQMLRFFTHIFVQDEGSEILLHKINIDQVSVAGDTRFDRVLAGKSAPGLLPQANSFCAGHKIIVAGSTWAKDEQLLRTAMAGLPGKLKLILVPHEVDAGHINEIMAAYGDMAVKWTEYTDEQQHKRVLVVDCVGLLLQLYSYADVAWVGGGFGRAGVHNVLEAAVYGTPVLHGPVYEQYLEARELVAAGGSLVITDAAAMQQTLANWDKDSAAYEHCGRVAGKYVLGKAGATEKILRYLEAKKLLSKP